MSETDHEAYARAYGEFYRNYNPTRPENMATKRTYTFEAGKILRNGEQCGTYDEESREIRDIDPDLPPNVRKIVENLLNKPATQEPAEVEEEEDDQTEQSSVPPPAPAASEYESDAPPPMDPMMGDKTPEYMEWLKRTNPKEFEKKYAHRKVGVPSSKPGEDVPDSSMPPEKTEEWK